MVSVLLRYGTTTFPSALPPNSCHSYSAYAVNDVQQPTFAIVCVRPQNIGRKWVNETQNNAVNVMCLSSHHIIGMFYCHFAAAITTVSSLIGR